MLALGACAALSGCGGQPASERAQTPDHTIELARELTDSAKSTGAPAVAAVVVDHGRLIWSAARGLADVSKRRPMTVKTPVYFASVGKMITAAVALRLQEKGLLRLDDRVRRWVPEWHGPATVTLRSLLNHTSGVHDPGERFYDAVEAGRRYTPADWIARLPAPERRAHPDFEYANANYILAGMAMRRAAGRQWAAVRHEIAPDLALQPDDRVKQPGAVSYRRSQDVDGKATAFTDASGYLPTRAFVTAAWTAGAWAGSPEHLALWANRLYSGRILQPASLRQMTTFLEPQHYGLGIAREGEGDGAAWSHSGKAPGLHTEFWHQPAAGVTVFVVWSTDLYSDETSLVDRLASIVVP